MQNRSLNPGCIVNLASTHGVVGAAGRSVYGISKAAIIHMTKMLAIEWAEHGIRVNAIAPGRVETRSRAGTLTDPKAREARLNKVPLHRFGTADIFLLKNYSIPAYRSEDLWYRDPTTRRGLAVLTRMA